MNLTTSYDLLYMSSKPKLKFYPYAALHVAVTEGHNARVSRLLHIWRHRWLNDECRRLWLRLKLKANEEDRGELVSAIEAKCGANSAVCQAILEMERLCNERWMIERKDVYYKSIHWESEEDSDEE